MSFTNPNVSSEAAGGGGSGEDNTGANVNTTGVGVFKVKAGVQLQFRGLQSSDGSVSVALDAPTNTIDLKAGISGAAGGDLSGTYPNPTVPGLTGKLDKASNLSDLSSASAARTNLGLGTSAVKNVPAAGNASSTEVVQGDDTRLTNSRAPSGAAGGDLAGTFPNPTLSTTGVAASTYGSSTLIPVITVDAKGRISNVTTASPSLAGAAGGDLAGTYPNPTLSTTGVTAGSYGNASHIPALTIDAKGRVTGSVSVPVEVTSSAVTDFATSAQTAVVQGSLAATSAKAPSVDVVNTALSTKISDPTTTDGDLLTRISGVLDRLAIGGEDFILRSIGGLPSWQEENLLQDIGDGSDGSVTLTGALTAPDNLYYTLFKPAVGGILNPDAYIVYAKTLDLSTAQAGAITRSGANGVNGANSAAGQAGGAAFTARVLATNGAGGAGAAGSTNAGVQGAAGGVIAIGNGGIGGASGTSGAGGSGASAASISGGTVTTNMHFGRFEYQFIRGVTSVGGGAGGVCVASL